MNWATVFILVHGTWGASMSWYQAQGDFFQAVEAGARRLGGRVTSFTWSGNLDNHNRRQAGKELAQRIMSYSPTTKIILIAHSHGGNVCMLASQELAAIGSKHRIHAVYNLGTPVNMKEYWPDMSVIDYVYNLFSLDDVIQPVMGMFERVYPHHPRIANLRVMIDGKGIDHEMLHAPCIGLWLPVLGKYALCGKPGLLNFSKDQPPCYCVDVQQTHLIAINKKLIQHLAETLSRNRPIVEPQEL